LPRLDGLSVIQRLRSQGVRVPILVLSAKASVDDRVKGLQAGGDDYLTKPFSPRELLARIRALLRRGRLDPTRKLQHDDLRMDLGARKVTRRDQSLELTGKEFEILECLLRHRGRIVSRELLAREVWHVGARATPLDNVIDVTMVRLRRKIDDPFEKKLLHTVRGVGFFLGARPE